MFNPLFSVLLSSDFKGADFEMIYSSLLFSVIWVDVFCSSFLAFGSMSYFDGFSLFSAWLFLTW
tara:strand:- start:322 stop:513 length:192 start_codon:yes stop_codon:yes gene_type:complete